MGLCLGLLGIATLYAPPKSRYDHSPLPSYPFEVLCDFVRVMDGDTVLVRCPQSSESVDKTLRAIRLWGIDAPEFKQEKWGKWAANALKKLIGKNKSIRIKIIEQDRYQRLIGQVYVDDVDLGLQMVKQGMAVVYHQYNHDQTYINAEKKAKISRLGIWRVAGAQQNPARWRQLNP